MLVFTQLRELRAITGLRRRMRVPIAAVLSLILALLVVPIGTAEGGGNGDGGGHANWRRTRESPRWYSPPPMPRVPTTSNTNSKPQNRKFDDDDKSTRKSEPKVTDKSKQRDDDDEDDDDRSKSRDDKGRRADRDSDLPSESAIPPTVAGVLKQLFGSPSPEAPQVNSGLRDLPRKLDVKSDTPSGPAKPLQKPTGRSIADLKLRVPALPTHDILVRNLSAATLSRLSAHNIKPESRRDLGVLGHSLTRLIIPPSMNVADAKSLLQQTDPSAVIDLNQRYRLYPSAREGDGARPQATNEPARTSGGCASDRCYGAATIGWQEKLSTCARGLNVGVIDTGIDSTHPSLAHNPERFKFGQFGPGFRGTGSDLHGTGVLALLAGNAKSSTPGLIPGAKFYVADIFFADENGLPVSTTLHLLEALEWMDRLRVQIINLSLSGPRDDLVQAAITRMSKPRTVDGVAKPAVIFIAAAGNGGPGAPPSYPAAYPEALAVTAVNRDLRSYRRANHGEYIDVAAPGVDIWTALPDGRQGYQTGTSFAVPFMTAVVASLYAGLPAHKSKEAILQRVSIQDLGPQGRDRIYGRGLVQAPAGCGPTAPWSPAVIARARPPAPVVQKTASR